MGKNIHVVPHNGQWAVKRENTTRSSVITNTKAEALELGKQFAINSGSDLVIHGKDGKIQDKDSYGPDPCPPKDKVH